MQAAEAADILLERLAFFLQEALAVVAKVVELAAGLPRELLIQVAAAVAPATLPVLAVVVDLALSSFAIQTDSMQHQPQQEALQLPQLVDLESIPSPGPVA
jgi:hypothetical protein